MTFVLGLWLGHRFSLGRDRRKERIAAAQAVRVVLLSHRNGPSPFDKWPSDAEFDLLERLLPKRMQAGFLDAKKDYGARKTEAMQRDSVGGAFYSDTAAIKAALEHLLSYTDWR